ncbi:hypothetical protein BDW71DRAFT_40248 [Aspergillus fruticulosus]
MAQRRTVRASTKDFRHDHIASSQGWPGYLCQAGQQHGSPSELGHRAPVELRRRLANILSPTVGNWTKYITLHVKHGNCSTTATATANGKHQRKLNEQVAAGVGTIFWVLHREKMTRVSARMPITEDKAEAWQPRRAVRLESQAIGITSR